MADIQTVFENMQINVLCEKKLRWKLSINISRHATFHARLSGILGSSISHITGLPETCIGRLVLSVRIKFSPLILNIADNAKVSADIFMSLLKENNNFQSGCWIYTCTIKKNIYHSHILLAKNHLDSFFYSNNFDKCCRWQIVAKDNLSLLYCFDTNKCKIFL